MSLTSLGGCINALVEKKKHIPFRDSMLTRLLKDALGGNSKTTLICTASKQLVHLEETISTLNFAQRAKKIKTNAAANVMRSPAEMMAMIERLKKEVASLKAQLLEHGIEPKVGDFKEVKELPPVTAANIVDEPEKFTPPEVEAVAAT